MDIARALFAFSFFQLPFSSDAFLFLTLDSLGE
jgi:hypothetical protein